MKYIPSDWPVTQKLIPASAATHLSLRHLPSGKPDDVLFSQGEILIWLINKSKELIFYWMIVSAIKKKIALYCITHKRHNFFGLKANLLFKSWIQRLTTCEVSLLYGAVHPSDSTILSVKLWHILFSPALHERVLQEVSLAWWVWTLYFPEVVLFAKTNLKRWGLEQISWIEYQAQSSFRYKSRDCKSHYKAKMPNTCSKTKLLQGKWQLKK